MAAFFLPYSTVPAMPKPLRSRSAAHTIMLFGSPVFGVSVSVAATSVVSASVVDVASSAGFTLGSATPQTLHLPST